MNAGAWSYERDAAHGTETWLTPRWILDCLPEFDLDPCGHPGWQTAKRHYIWPQEDGLLLPWSGRVWCNPPYGTQAQAWAQRMALHNDGVLLLFARTETRMFQRLWQTAEAMLFLYGRVAFLRGDGSEADGGNAPSVLVAFGTINGLALSVARDKGLKGALVTGWKP